MVPPIPIRITQASSYTTMAPLTAPSKRCSHAQGLTVNTTDLAPWQTNSDTPPVTPISKVDIASGIVCSCSLTSADDGYQLLQQSALTPPRTPKTLSSTPLDFRKASTIHQEEMNPESTSTSCSGYALVDSSETSSGLESLANESSVSTVPSVTPAQLTPFAPKGTFSVLKNARPFGHGAWSVVYPGLFTPTSSSNTEPELIAVKKPEQKKGVPILTNEASILSYLSTPEPTCGVIPFYGFDETTTSLLLPAYPLTLESFVKASQKFINSEENISLSTLRCPVVKMRQWLFIAKKLCEGFIALKKKQVVHGDVKWGNILLREYIIPIEEQSIWGDNSDEALYEPIIVDFSSSHIEPSEPRAISALTVAFCAPELLEAFLSPVEEVAPMPTFSSDLYSLALTLLTTAIGSDPYSIRAASDARKGMWVKCGDPLGFVQKGDDRGLRVRKGEVVDACLAGCFGRTADGRTSVEIVLERVNERIKQWCQEGKGDNRWGC